MSKSGQFLAQKCLFLGVAEGPLNISPLQNVREKLTKSPMYNTLKIYEDALLQTFFIWQNVLFYPKSAFLGKKVPFLGGAPGPPLKTVRLSY